MFNIKGQLNFLPQALSMVLYDSQKEMGFWSRAYYCELVAFEFKTVQV
jgi:hypothetical protein